MSGRSAAAPATAPAARAGARHASALRFASVLLGMTLLLQRFGLPLGGKSFSIVGPLGLALAGWYLARGVLALNRFRLMAYIAFACCVALGMAWQATRPVSVLTGFTGGADLDSLAQFLPLTAFAVLDFAEPVDEAAFFRMVTAWFGVIAAAGLAQFAAQFAGASLFAFTGLLPASLLIEHDYNLIIPLGVDHLLKSNGFFLVEPSTFSQIMALARGRPVVASRIGAFAETLEDGVHGHLVPPDDPAALAVALAHMLEDREFAANAAVAALALARAAPGWDEIARGTEAAYAVLRAGAGASRATVISSSTMNSTGGNC